MQLGTVYESLEWDGDIERKTFDFLPILPRSVNSLFNDQAFIGTSVCRLTAFRLNGRIGE
jgi:hypothetical protein